MAASDVLRAHKTFNSGTGAATGLFVTVDITALGIVSGDQLAVAIQLREPAATLSAWRVPTGWTLRQNPTQASGSFYVYTAKYGTDVTGSSWTWDNGAGNTTSTRWAASLIALKGNNATGLAGSSGAAVATGTTSWASGSVSPAGQALLIGFAGARNTGGTSWTWPAGWVEEDEDLTQTGTNAATIGSAVDDTTPVSAGTYSVAPTGSSTTGTGAAAILAYTYSSAAPPASGTSEIDYTVAIQAVGATTGEELFQGGTDGATVTTTLAPFFTAADAGWTFSATPTPAQGSLAARLDVPVSTLRMLTKTYGAALTGKRYYRFYMRMPTAPGNATSIVNVKNSGTTLGGLRMGSDGTLNLRDGTTTRWSSTSLPTGEWFRVGLMVDSASLQIQARIFTGINVHGNTADQDSGVQTLTTGGPDRVTFGADNGAVSAWTVYYDAVAESSTTWVGPTTNSPNANTFTSFSEGFEGGVANTPVTTTNTAFTSVDPNWTFIDFPKAAGGGLSASVTVAADELSMLRRTRTATSLYFTRFYLYLPSIPATSNGIVFVRAGSSVISTVRVTTLGQIALRDGGTTRWTSSALSRHQWVRVELKYDSAGHQMQARLYQGLNVHGAVADQDSGVQTLTGTNPSSVTLGIDNGSAGPWSVLFDEFTESVSDWPGPVSAGNAPPNAAQAELTVSATAQGPFSMPSTSSLLARASKVTPSATFTTKYQQPTPAAKTTYDMRGSQFQGYFFADAIFGFGTFSDGAGGTNATTHQLNNVPFEIGGNNTPATELAVVGGVVTGDQSTSLTWEQMKHGTPTQTALDAGQDPANVYSTVIVNNQNQDGDPRIHVANGSWALVDGLRCYNTHDGLGLQGTASSINSDTGRVWVRNFWVNNCHDDAIENDLSYLQLNVDDCLFEDVFSFISTRAGVTIGVPSLGKTQKVTNSIISLKAMPGVHKAASSVVKHGHLYKSQDNSPGLQIKNTIFAASAFATTTAAQLPDRPGLDSYENVTIVWTGTGGYPGNVPVGVTVTTDTTILSTAISLWKTRHGVTDFNTVDMAKMISPSSTHLKQGTNSINALRVGGTTVTAMYVGSAQVWP